MKKLLKLFLFSYLSTFCLFSSAQNSTIGYPLKPIKIVVPFGPGGIADLTARVVGQKLSVKLGQSVVIENRPSAGGIVAGEMVAKSEPDGYTLLLMSNGTAVSSAIFQKLPFDPVKDFEPISTLGYFDIGFFVNQSSPYKTLPEFIAATKAHPGKMNLASINIGSTQHLSTELFKNLGGLDIQVVPFNGTPAVVTALRGGQVDGALEILGPMVPQVKSNAVRLLAVSSRKRSAFFPETPTIEQSGIKEYAASSWNAIAAPAKTPEKIITSLNQAINEVVKDPEVKAKLDEIYVESQGSTPKELKNLLENDIKRWSMVIDKAHIPKQ
ncbi:Bug family tripartite tricarboxylate transporter substrate binding protein [Polynucleobacter kasalickyi]|uniref:Tripartite-type tricarboxylate transporter, receptor component TctC n=1 Tax=Polynucleobacter kasalickyi TaxID=1938817 RepID=A0A1W1Y3M0_9BURK|nr:tripartite tricarboxylate transporter substrate binding protein [Polynucleobacter kasalickyi]SMC30736.1 Tripartite-type tricarboxylate transporter, receptor component TctC [Polynucleobacter kasalickyi]